MKLRAIKIWDKDRPIYGLQNVDFLWDDENHNNKGSTILQYCCVYCSLPRYPGDNK